MRHVSPAATEAVVRADLCQLLGRTMLKTAEC